MRFSHRGQGPLPDLKIDQSASLKIVASSQMLHSTLPGKFISLIKVWHLSSVRDLQTDRQSNRCLLNHAAKIPRLSEFIRGLMIVCCVVRTELFLAPFLSVTYVFISFFQADRGHTDLGERKMVCPKEG